jgi:hypothetical protein
VPQLADFLRVFTLSLDFFRADETECEAAYEGHVLGAVTTAVAREIVLELNIEQPVQTPQ